MNSVELKEPEKPDFSGTMEFSVVAVFPVLLLLCPQAHAASPDALTENLYARAGGGVFFLDMSESSPFIRTNNREEVVGFLDHYDAAFRAGPLVNLAVGGEYDAFGKTCSQS